MTREAALLLTIAFAVVLIGIGFWAWRRRRTRDADPLMHAGELPDDAHVRAEFEALYVATTRRNEPLERIAAPGLGMRSRATVTVTDEGVAIDLTGQERFVLTPDRIVDVGQSTVAIDRVVEKDGLVRLTWRTLADTVVDTYFRPQDASAKALADTIRPLIPAHAPSSSTQTGADS
jgi:cbb3-type cytochrome oxidase subunit 3